MPKYFTFYLPAPVHRKLLRSIMCVLLKKLSSSFIYMFSRLMVQILLLYCFILNFTCKDNLCTRCVKNLEGLIIENLKMFHDSDAWFFYSFKEDSCGFITCCKALRIWTWLQKGKFNIADENFVFDIKYCLFMCYIMKSAVALLWIKLKGW